MNSLIIKDGMKDAAPAIFLSSCPTGTIPSIIPQTLPVSSRTGPPHKPSGKGLGVDVRNRVGEA